MRTLRLKFLGDRAFLTLAAFITISLASPNVRADGSETLGAPVGVALAAGSGFAVGGLGLSDTNAGTLTLALPTNATVSQVLLYWQGVTDGPVGDDTISVGTNSVTGSLIGGPTLLFPGVFESAYRVDITGLGLVGTGTNQLEVSGLDFSKYNNGVGAIVIYSNTAPVQLGLVDGDDFALHSYVSPLDATVPQTFTFRPASVSRPAKLGLLVGGSEGKSTLLVTVGRTTSTALNLFQSNNGPAWDSVEYTATIPPGATNLTVQVASGAPAMLPGEASLISWVAAAMSLPAVSNHPPRVHLRKMSRELCAGTNGLRAELHGIVSDRDRDMLTVQWFVNDVSVETNTVSLRRRNCANIEFKSRFYAGTNVVRVEVSDGTNAPATAQAVVKVTLDDEPPVVTCKEPKTRRANARGVAHAPRLQVEARDNCTPKHKLVKVQTPRAGTLVPTGTNTILITVTDKVGNSTTCTNRFIVTPHSKPGDDDDDDRGHGSDDDDD